MYKVSFCLDNFKFTAEISNIGIYSLKITHILKRKSNFTMLSTLGESTENTRIHLDGLYNCLIRYFTKKEWLIDVKIDFSGYKDKEIHILRNLMKVPPGYITTYCLLARYTLKSNAYRYIGNILAHNRLQLIVPCHRVVKNNLKLGGFTNPLGIELKILLLQNEGIIVNNNKIEHPRIYQF